MSVPLEERNGMRGQKKSYEVAQKRFLGLQIMTGPHRGVACSSFFRSSCQTAEFYSFVLISFLKEALATIGQTSALDLSPVESEWGCSLPAFSRKVVMCVGVALLAGPWNQKLAEVGFPRDDQNLTSPVPAAVSLGAASWGHARIAGRDRASSSCRGPVPARAVRPVKGSHLPEAS